MSRTKVEGFLTPRVNWNLIGQAISGLDGEDRTEVLFGDETGRILLHVSGGGGNYLLSLTWPERVLNLYGPDQTDSTLVSFIAAGQRVEVPKWGVADLGTTLQAAEHFARTGEPDPSLLWYPSGGQDRPTRNPLPTMHPENGDWILVYGSKPEAIRKAVEGNSSVSACEVPSSHRVSIFGLDSDRFGVRFYPKILPYDFVNLIAWLNDPELTPGSTRVLGWLTSPASGVRYYLTPKRPNEGCDTLLGVRSDGVPVSVSCSGCRLSRTPGGIDPIPEPPESSAVPLTEFEITADADRSYGNPDFVEG